LIWIKTLWVKKKNNEIHNTAATSEKTHNYISRLDVEPPLLSIDPIRIVARTNDDKVIASVFFIEKQVQYTY
jgi:hypothetical protein